MFSAQIRPLSAGLCLLIAAACGGGGGGGGGNNVTQAPPPPVNNAPVASFSLDATSGAAPLVVTANAATSSDSDGQVVAYAWDFDGDSAIGSVAQYTFDSPGGFTVSLTVTDDDGATATTSRTVSVSAPVSTSTLSGTVRILSSTAVDADVNDRLTVGTSNNTFDLAQPLPTPATLGGYANVAGQGESTGNLFDSGDPADFYQVSLNGDEVIVLSIADLSADLDLRLWDEQRNIVDASLGVGGTETIAVPSAGNYFIEVVPFTGASNYVLYVGQNITSAALPRAAVRLSDPFVPGELIIKHRPAKLSRGLRALVQSGGRGERYSGPGLYALRATAEQKLQLPPGAGVDAEQRLKLRTLIELKAQQADADNGYAELNMLAQAHATPNDSFYGSQWHYPAINLPIAWDTTTGSPDVIVAVVDTGVLLDHPDLDNKLVDGYDFVSSTTRSLDGDGIDPDPNDPGDLEFGGSSSFHGTHVAGTVGAESNNGSGVAGVAWQTRIMPLRALGKDGGSTFDIVQAVRYAAGLSNNSGTVPTQRADIINLSLGSTFSSQSEQDAYSEAIQAGVIIIASAGNESTSLPSYPAAYDGVISVAATTITNGIAGYSNFGSAIDVAAPGGSNITDLNGDGIGDGVISTMGDDSSAGPVEFGYLGLSGTSMAAPHVAGVAALMKAVYPQLTPAQFDAALVAGDLTDDLGSPGRDDTFGYGLINAQKAVIAAQQFASGSGVDPGPILTASASTLNFSGFLTNLGLTVQNVGTGSPTITDVIADQPWLTITAPGSADGLGQYNIAVDRTGLSDGAYQATLSFESDANNLTVNIIMQVSSLNLSADAGLFYIILVDANGDTVLPAVLVTADQGEYPFTINEVPAGQYRLFAGSDADDDAILCDAGEACGAYPTLDSPDFIAINGDLSNLDFESGFRVNLSADAQTSSVLSNDAGGVPFAKPAAAEDVPE